MAEEVEGDVAERDILFELGRVRDPAAQLLGEDERVVTEPQCILRDVGARRAQLTALQLEVEVDRVDRYVAVPVVDVRLVHRGHRCGTPSDAV